MTSISVENRKEAKVNRKEVLQEGRLCKKSCFGGIKKVERGVHFVNRKVFVTEKVYPNARFVTTFSVENRNENRKESPKTNHTEKVRRW